MLDVERALQRSDRERKARKQAEALLEQRSRELYLANVELEHRLAELAAVQEQLRHKEASIRAIVECAGDGIMTIDEAGRIGLFNPAAERLFGYTSAEVAGQMIDVLSGSGSNAFAAAFRQLASRPNPSCTSGGRPEIEVMRRDGEIVMLELHVSRMNLDSERAFIAMVRDITERHRAEKQLKELQRQNIEVARRAGMADIATSVLHNVGNVLNSVNVSTALIGDHVQKLGIADYKRAIEMLQAHQDDPGAFITSDPRGKHLPRFLIELSRKMTARETEIHNEIGSLGKSIAHIREIVSMQQNYAGGAGFIEEVSLAEIIEDAIRMNGASADRHQIDMQRDFVELPRMLIDKQKVIQILVNLLSNAKHAIVEGQVRRRVIVIRVTKPAAARVRIEVIDSGMGISADNLTRIFSQGFTTRKDGHGFGLHGAANLAREMGGDLTVDSAGVGCGATFILDIPFKTTGTQNETAQPSGTPAE
jgi:PAS domain S-box-containing protein